MEPLVLGHRLLPDTRWCLWVPGEDHWTPGDDGTGWWPGWSQVGLALKNRPQQLQRILPMVLTGLCCQAHLSPYHWLCPTLLWSWAGPSTVVAGQLNLSFGGEARSWILLAPGTLGIWLLLFLLPDTIVHEQVRPDWFVQRCGQKTLPGPGRPCTRHRLC